MECKKKFRMHSTFRLTSEMRSEFCFNRIAFMQKIKYKSKTPLNNMQIELHPFVSDLDKKITKTYEKEKQCK